MKIIEVPADEEYDASKFFNYAGLTDVIGFASVSEGENSFALTASPTVGNKVIAVLRDTTSGTLIEYDSQVITVTDDIPQTGSVVIKTSEITDQTSRIIVSIDHTISSGILRVIEVPAGKTYDSSLFLDASAKLGDVYLNALKPGDNTVVFDRAPEAGSSVVAVLRDASDGDIVDYVSDPITVGGKPSVLSNCSVEIVMEDGKTSFSEDDTTATVKVKLDESLSDVYMILIAYPGNASFDPDSIANKRLYSARVNDGDTVKCSFYEGSLPLKAGYRIAAYYKDGVLIKTEKVTVKGTFSYDIAEVDGANEIRLFLWENEETLTPLFEAAGKSL